MCSVHYFTNVAAQLLGFTRDEVEAMTEAGPHDELRELVAAEVGIPREQAMKNAYNNLLEVRRYLSEAMQRSCSANLIRTGFPRAAH